MPVIEEKRIGAYIHTAVQSLYSCVLHIRGLQQHESQGGGVAILPREDSYGDDMIMVKIDGSSISIAEGQYGNDLETIGLEDPNSIERFWKILNKHVMEMIDKKAVRVMNDIREYQENLNNAMQEQIKLMTAKTHIVSKMVMNPAIVDFDDIDLKPKEYPHDDGIPF